MGNLEPIRGLWKTIRTEIMHLNRMNYDAGTGPLSNWEVEESGFDDRTLGKGESLFAQGNGYMGLRASLEESYVGETRDWFVNGTFDDFDGQEVTELANLPDIARITVRINGERFRLDSGTVRACSRKLNLKTGELTREAEWVSPGGNAVKLRFARLVSLPRRHIAAQRMELTPLGRALRVEIESGIDARVSNTGTQHFSEGEKRFLEGRVLQSVQKTLRSGVETAVHTVHRLFQNGKPVEQAPFPVIERRQLLAQFSAGVPEGETLAFEKISSVCTSRDLPLPEEPEDTPARRGLAAVRAADALGYAGLEAENERAWAAFWEEDGIVLDGPGFDQLAVRTALYHMRIMYGGGDSRLGIGAKAMSGEGYKGHSFWDTETFLLPFFLYTRPEDARRLLEYRYLCRGAARRKAKENGCEGMMFPWESAWVDDSEATPLWGAADVRTGKAMKILTGLIEIHITADIAFAVDQYFRVTGDRDFMDRCGYELLFGTAQFWASRAEWNAEKERYELRDVIGPDEYKEHVNNNAYTNYMACRNLELALEAERKLRAEEPALYARLSGQFNLPALAEKLREVRSRFYLPAPGEDGVIPQDDTYLSLREIDLAPYKNASAVGTIYNDYNIEEIDAIRVTKQADVVLLLNQFPGRFGEAVERGSYAYYEARTLHDSSLSFASHSLAAARIGLGEEAYGLFQKACAVDLGPNLRSSDAGIHAASMGGIWQDAVLGFGGVSMEEDTLCIRPRLPRQWNGMRFPLRYRGTRLACAVTRETLTVRNNGPEAVELLLCSEPVRIEAGSSCTRPLG